MRLDEMLGRFDADTLRELREHHESQIHEIDRELARRARIDRQGQIARNNEAVMASAVLAYAEALETGSTRVEAICRAKSLLDPETLAWASEHRPAELMIESRAAPILKRRQAEKRQARDREIAGLAFQGWTDGRIAAKFGLHPVTVNRIVAQARRDGKIMPTRWKPKQAKRA